MKFWSIILVLIIFICCYVGVYHSHRYFKFHSIILWISIVGPITLVILDEMWFKPSGVWQRFRSFLLMALIAGIVIFLHHLYSARQLARYGVRTHGVVTGLIVHGGQSKGHEVTFDYRANDRKWTQELFDIDKSLVVGDTLQLLCSSVDPELFKRLD